MSPWSTAADVRDRVRRRWDDGTLLRAWAAGEPCPVLEVPLRGPRAGDIGDDLVAVREWAKSLHRAGADGRRFEVVTAPVGGRHIGRNVLPVRAVVSRYEQAWDLLGVGGQIATLRTVLDLAAPEPDAAAWVRAAPLQALTVASEWPTVLAAYRWLADHRDSHLYLRQITATGVDTKFVERHRSVLASLLGVSAGAAGFVRDLGLRAKPETVRLRVDPAVGLAGPFTEAVVGVEELRRVTPDVSAAEIVENEVTYLSVPVPPGGVVIWGKGFEVDRAGSLPWLADAGVRYWGDLDTHGFAILDRLRAWLPQTRSVLMDRPTLLAHRDRWVREASPTRARLRHLTAEEADLYDDLVSDRLGERVRLEQERVDWEWALKALSDPSDMAPTLDVTPPKRV